MNAFRQKIADQIERQKEIKKEQIKETIEKRNVTKNKENSNKETMVSFGMRRKGCFVCFKYGII